MKLPCGFEAILQLISLAVKKKWPKLCLRVACVSHETSFVRIIINFHSILKHVLCYKILIVTVVFYRNFLLVSGTVWAHLPITLMTAMKVETITDVGLFR